MFFPKSAFRLFVLGFIVCASAMQSMAQVPVASVNPATPRVLQFLQPANNNDFRTSQLLGIPTSNCQHVIQLMIQNQMRERLGDIGSDEIFFPHLTVGMKPGDLELLCVNLVCDGHAESGPVFQVSMRNNSCVPIGNFKVSVVGVLCQIHEYSPSATVCIDRMEAGEELLIQIQLPLTCMCMGPIAQQAAFDTVVVALDSYDELLECNELNNVQILKRAEIGLLVAEPVQAAPVQTLPAIPTPIGPDSSVPNPTDSQKEGSLLDGLDLDKLNQEAVQNQLFRAGS